MGKKEQVPALAIFVEEGVTRVRHNYNEGAANYNHEPATGLGVFTLGIVGLALPSTLMTSCGL